MSLNRFYHILKGLKKDLFPILIVIIVGILFIVNYQPGTWLSGWDALHPEFNFRLYFKRIFNFWQEHQGLGAPSAQAHLSELPRVLILFPLSFVLPQSFLRYGYFLLTMLLGPLGVYYFLSKIIFKQSKFENKIASFIASIFYLLNIGTIQHFYVPLEMFPTQFAYLGWLFLFACQYLETRKQKDLLLFLLINFLSAPMAHTATLWHSYFFSFAVFLLIYALFNKQKRWQTIKRSVALALTTLVANAYWLIPNLYFVLNFGKQVADSHIHSLFTPEAFYSSAQYGTFKDLALLKNFLFNWYVFDFKIGKFVSLLLPWIKHFSLFSVITIAFSLTLIALLGICNGFKNKKKITLGLISISLIAVFFWLNINPPLGTFFHLLRKNLSLFKEAFRFPFTKFSILLIFPLAVFLGLGINRITRLFSTSFLSKKIVGAFFLIFFSCLVFYYSVPSFQGNYISPQMRVNIPDQYFQLFNWFDMQEQGRIGFLPANSMWGWNYYKWGYQGAGFLWFGLKQPLLVREFDRWYPTNELFYHQFSQAIYSQNLDQLESVLEKYATEWLVLDKNIVELGDYKALYFDETKELLEKSSKISLEKSFGNIQVYRVKLQAPAKDFVFLAQNLPQVGPEYQWNNDDQAFEDLGHYITIQTPGLNILNPGVEEKADIYYPFRSLFTGRKQDDLQFSVIDNQDYWLFESKPFDLPTYKLHQPQLDEIESIHWTENLEEQQASTPLTHIYEDGIQVEIDKKSGYFSYDSREDSNFLQTEAKSCNPFNVGQMDREVIYQDDNNVLQFESLGSSNCKQIFLPHFIQKKAYLVKVKSMNIQGQPLLFKVINETSKNVVIETKLPEDSNPGVKSSETPGFNISYFVIPMQEPYGQGYTLSFDNISIGREQTINRLARVEVYPIPYNFLKNIKLTKDQPGRDFYAFVKSDNFQVSHPNPSFYKIKITNNLITNNSFLILSQSFDKGWTAWVNKPFFGKRIKSHLLINNWQNGWKLNQITNNSITNNPITISIIYWPQLLQYLGFAILLGFVAYLIVEWRRSKN
jgi:hypothetical protein